MADEDEAADAGAPDSHIRSCFTNSSGKEP
jgi:hypothetical protein